MQINKSRGLSEVCQRAGRSMCLSSIILSPLDCNVKMSPHETGDIYVESEATAASERNQLCIKGDLACASAAALLGLSLRQIKRLKKRMREDGEAALAHANRGRPSPRRLPERTGQAAVRLAPCKYAGFNDQHLCEKLNEVEGLQLSRETLRRLLRKEGLGSPRKRRAPAHRQHLVRAWLANASWCNWTAARTTGSRAVGRALPLWACRTTLPAKSWPRNSFLRKPAKAIFACCRACCAALAYPRRSTATAAVSLSATTMAGLCKRNSLVSATPRSSVARWPISASPLSRRNRRRPKAASNGSGACCKIACAVNSVWLKLLTSIPPTPCRASSSRTTTAASPALRAKLPRLGVPLPMICGASALPARTRR